MPEPNTATKPKRRSPVTSTANVRVELTKVVSDDNFKVTKGTEDDIEVHAEAWTMSDGTITLTRAKAVSLLACLKAFLSGRGTGTPRKKK